jgi:fatty-acyl-CoA synthase
MPLEPRDLPSVDLGTLLTAQANAPGTRDQPVVITRSGTMTYRELDELSNAFARSLVAWGVRRGDRVALLAHNCPEWIVSAFGIVKAGATMVSLSTWYGKEDTEYALAHTGAVVAVVSDHFLGHDYLEYVTTAAANGGLPALRAVVVLPVDGGPVDTGGPVPVVSWWDTVTARSREPFASRATSTDVGYMLLTSGTTGRPKAAQLRQDGLVLNSFHVGRNLGIGPGDRCFMPVPLCFARGCVQILLSVVTRGATIVLQRRFDAEDALALISEHSCSVLFAVPQMVRTMAELPSFSPSLVRTLTRGRVGHGRADLEYAVEHLGLTEVCNGYGMTEVYGPCALTRHDDPLADRLQGWCEVLPGVEVRIADPDTGEQRPAGTEGEIRVRSYGPPGYFADEDRNAAAFDADGYFRTGDKGVVRADGRLRYLGRYKDLIKVNGLNIAPATVEFALQHIGGVVEACVFGMPDPLREESVAAAVYVDTATDEAGIIGHCRDLLKTHEVPRRVWVSADPLAKLSGGKLDRRRIREVSLASFDREGVR